MYSFSAPRVSSSIKYIMMANVAIYVITLFPGIGHVLMKWGALIPSKTFAAGQLWRLVTYMFLHDPNHSLHLLLNMLFLWMFSHEIEELWGSRRFIIFYFMSGIGAGCFSLFHLFFPVMRDVSVIGASGAVLAMLTAFAWYFPDRNLLLFFLFPVNIRIVVIGYALISLFGTITPHDTTSHITHLGGIIVAIVYLKWYPVVSGWIEVTQSRRNEQRMRRQVEVRAGDKRFFEEQIDPILAKISREGMASLTSHEKRLLDKASRLKNQDLLKTARIIPFDLFKKRKRTR